MTITNIDTRNSAVFLILAQPRLTLPAELVHLVMNHFLDAAPVGHPRVVVEGLERFAGAVGFGVGFAILTVCWGAGVAALRVLPGGERAVGSAFLHFHGCLYTTFSIKCGSQRQFSLSDSAEEKQNNEDTECWFLNVIISIKHIIRVVTMIEYYL